MITMAKKNIGNMTRRIVIEQKMSTPDGSGGFLDNYIDFCTIFAEYWVPRGMLFLKSDSHNESMTYAQFRFRETDKTTGLLQARPDNFRIRYGNRFYLPTEILPDERDHNRYITVRATGGDFLPAGPVT